MNETSEHVVGPTPHGGAYSIAYWQDEEGQPTTKAKAKRAEIIEYDEDGKAIARTYGDIGG